ncbi:MAG: hypothetical protein R2882_05180 [Gemmatimonadales bacterium]
MIKSRSAAMRLLALAFSLGALVGGAATMVAERGTHRPPPRSKEAGRKDFVQRLDQEVALTAEQEEAVAGILTRHEPVMDSIWAAVRVQFDNERQLVRRDIRAALTPEQVAKYDAMLARRDSVRRARESKHGDK